MKVGPPLNMAMFLSVFIHQSSNTYLIELLACNIVSYLYIGDFPTPWEQGEGPQVRITCLGCKQCKPGVRTHSIFKDWVFNLELLLPPWMDGLQRYLLSLTNKNEETKCREEKMKDRRWNLFPTLYILFSSQKWEGVERNERKKMIKMVHGKGRALYIGKISLIESWQSYLSKDFLGGHRIAIP